MWSVWSIFIYFWFVLFQAFVFMVQESLNHFGLTGPIKIYGTPLQFGMIIYFHYRQFPSAPPIQVDLFFTQVDGGIFSSPLWIGQDQKSCHYPNSGFQYVDYNGLSVLAPVDHEAYLRTAYGPEFMIPQGIKGYLAVNTVADSIESEDPLVGKNAFAGMAKTYVSMCTAYDKSCFSPFGREAIFKQMILYVTGITNKTGLRYSLACDSHRSFFDHGLLSMFV